MPDQVASLLPSGAGRFQDFIWPDPAQMLTNGVGSLIRSRVGGGAEAPGQVIIFGAGLPASVGVGGGQALQAIPCDVANAGSQRLFYPGFPVTLRTSRTPIDGRTDDCAAYRFFIVMSFLVAAIAANGELGFQLSQYNGGAGQRIVADAAPGIGINCLPSQGGGNIEVVIRGPNGLKYVDTGVGQAASTFDLRFFSATATADAFWTLRINGNLVTLSAINSTWGLGTNLPPAALSGGSVGFVPSLVASAQASTTLAVHSVELMCGPNEINLL